jgi:hypothetical protein
MLNDINTGEQDTLNVQCMISKLLYTKEKVQACTQKVLMDIMSDSRVER